MIEVEIKAYFDNETKLEPFEQLLYQIGAKYIRTINQTDIYFQHPKKDFKKTDEALRIRQEEKKLILTYKGPKIEGKSKTREELEVHLDDQAKMQEILQNLGFKAFFPIKKTRKLFSLNRIKISIDKIEELGTFIELETKVKTKEEVPEAVKILLEKIKLLGISENRLERRSYLELLIEKLETKN